MCEQSRCVGGTGIVTGDMVLDDGNDFGDGTGWGCWRPWPVLSPTCSVLISCGTGLSMAHTCPQKFSGYSASIPWGQSSLMALLRPQWPRLSGWQAREVISSRSGARSSRPKTLTQFKTPTLLDPFSRSWRSLWDQDLCWDGVWIGRYHCTLCP